MEFGQRWRENRWARDAVSPTLILLLVLVTGGGQLDGIGTWGGRTTMMMSVLLTIPLYWRRTQPEIVFGITAFLALRQLALSAGPLIGDLAVPLVVHATTAYARDRAWGWAALGAGLFGSQVGP